MSPVLLAGTTVSAPWLTRVAVIIRTDLRCLQTSCLTVSTPSVPRVAR
jgi:hypothetical protein